jgi:hypothetical protein
MSGEREINVKYLTICTEYTIQIMPRLRLQPQLGWISIIYLPPIRVHRGSWGCKRSLGIIWIVYSVHHLYGVHYPDYAKTPLATPATPVHSDWWKVDYASWHNLDSVLRTDGQIFYINFSLPGHNTGQRVGRGVHYPDYAKTPLATPATPVHSDWWKVDYAYPPTPPPITVEWVDKHNLPSTNQSAQG